MYKVNENVIHKSAGACYISDIVTSDFGNGPTQYYKLKPRFPTIVNKTLEIYLPIDKEIEFLRKPISSSDVLHLINIIPEMEKIWVNDAKARKQLFESIYHSGDIKGLCQLVKLLYVDQSFFSKPMSLTDKTFLTKVRTNIFDEFAVALNITPVEIDSFISARIKK